MLRPSPNHGTQRLPNDDDDDDFLVICIAMIMLYTDTYYVFRRCLVMKIIVIF